VIGTEKMTDIIDPADRSTAFLFADGAGAILVGPSADQEIGPVVWGADGSRHHLISHTHSWLSSRENPPIWPTMRMAGPEVFRWVIQEMTEVARKAVAEAGLSVSDLAAFVPHQANMRMIDKMAQAIGLPASVVVARDVKAAGNTSAASIPLALEALLTSDEPVPRGMALLVGFGSGLSYAALATNLPSA
jgi:3-oxoacyl-[acyl-carrier-protein] synthase-3